MCGVWYPAGPSISIVRVLNISISHVQNYVRCELPCNQSALCLLWSSLLPNALV